MADYNDITLTATEVAVMAALSGMIGSALIMNPTSDTNIPTNSKRFVDIGSGRFQLQNWNGASWAAVQLDAHTLQGLEPGDIDYSAGEGIDIDGSNVISVEQASDVNLGAVLLAITGDSTSTDKAATPALITELLAGAGTSVVAAPAAGTELEANKRYIVDDVNTFQWWLLPEAPADGTVITLWSNDASQGSVCFVAQGADGVRRDDADPRITDTLSSTITADSASQLEDSAQTFVDGAYDGYRVKNTTDGSIGCIEARVSDTVQDLGTPALVGGTENDFDIGDSYTIDGGAAYISDLFNWQKIELIYRADFDYWTFHTSDGTSNGLVVNPNSEARGFFSSVPERLEDALAALDDILGVAGHRYLAVDFPLRFTGRMNYTYFLQGDSGSVSELVVSVNYGSGTYESVRDIINIGDVNVRLDANASYTSFILVEHDGTITDNLFDVIVPPGESCKLARLHTGADYVDDDTLIAFRCSPGVYKLTS